MEARMEMLENIDTVRCIRKAENTTRNEKMQKKETST